MLAVFETALATFAPHPDALVERLAEEIDHAMLLDMARLDYGRDVADNLAALRRLRSGTVLPAPMAFAPREVLELTRWFRPDDEPVAERRRRGHVMRAFACAHLLRASGELGNHALCEGQNQTLVNLLWSLDALRGAHERAAIGLVAWLMGRLAPDQRPPDAFDWYFDDVPFLGLAILWLGLRMRPRLPDVALVAVCEWTSEAEESGNHRHNTRYGLAPGRWLLAGTTHNLCHAEWRRLGRVILDEEVTGLSGETADWVRLIATLLAE